MWVCAAVFATGGREKDLCVWDLEAGKEVFVARNVKHDKLDMQVPIWITDLAVRGAPVRSWAAPVSCVRVCARALLHL